MELYNFKTPFTMVETLWGVEPSASDYEDIAMVAWEKIGNRHTHLYKITVPTVDNKIQLPCNCTAVESVTIPFADAQVTDPRVNFANTDNIYIEEYIDHFPTIKEPLYDKGKFVKYREEGNELVFYQNYPSVTVVYHGILADEEGLPKLNNREIKAIAAYVAYVNVLRDGMKRRDAGSINLAKQVIYPDWLRECNAARSIDYMSQNEMDAIFDAKYSWNKKHYGKSIKPAI